MTRRRKPKAPTKSTAPAVPTAGVRLSEPAWLAIGALSLVALSVASRGALFGVPVADDYDFLYWLRFHPFALFDSMGAPYYWRPVSRQLYFALVSPILYSAPWLVSVLHAVLLAATSFFLYRIARRAWSPGVSVAIAVFPLVSEPARTLLVWPTGAQYLLAMLGAVVAVHEALAERKAAATLAALFAILSHGAAAPALAALPVIAWVRTRNRRTTLVWTGLMAAVAAIWVGGHWLGREHGTHFFAGGTLDATFPQRLLRAAAIVTTALFNLEDAQPLVAMIAWAGYGALLTLALFLFATDRGARARLQLRAPTLLGAAAWFGLAIAPLALLFPDWSSWRTGLAALGLGVFLVGLLGTARPWLAAGFAVLLTGTLLAAPTAPVHVSKYQPVTTSRMGFIQLVRLERTVDFARRLLESSYPTLRRGADVAYWSRVGMTEVGFEREKAVRVWYEDSTIAWGWLWENGLREPHHDATFTFEVVGDSSSILIRPETMSLIWRSVKAFESNQMPLADSLLVEIYRTQKPFSSEIGAWVVLRRSHVAFNLKNFARADSLNQVLGELTGEGANYCGMQSALELQRGNMERALIWLRRCLAQDPNNEVGRRVERAIDIIRARAPAAG